MKPIRLFLAWLGVAFAIANPVRAITVLNFEGVGDGNWIGSYYSLYGGGGDYSVNISGYVLVDSDAGGSGNIANEPSASTVWAVDGTDTMNVYAGFTALSFAYSARLNGSYAVHSGPDGTGTLLASGTLAATPVGAGDPNGGSYGVWLTVAPAFGGIARSVTFTSGSSPFNGSSFLVVDNVGMELLPRPIPIAIAGASTSPSSATLAGTVNPGGQDTSVYFQYGNSPGSYIYTLAGTPPTVSGSSATPVSFTLTALSSQQRIYWRISTYN